jgi:hypothetical protein
LTVSDGEIAVGCVDRVRLHGRRDSVHFRPVACFGDRKAQAFHPQDIRSGGFVLAFLRASKPRSSRASGSA